MAHKKHHKKHHKGHHQAHDIHALPHDGHGHKHHIGEISHGNAHLDGLGRDPLASAEHHANNRKHGMHEGLCPAGGKKTGDGHMIGNASNEC